MREMGVGWWDEWDIGDGTIGQRYGATVKRYDLINRLIEDIKNDPYGRRKIVSLWQETDLRETPGLAPCAFQTIWNVRGEYLDMLLVQRSGDMLTASGPGGINEIQYAALLMMIARHTGYKPGVFSHMVANEQIYDRHMDAADDMRSRFSAREQEEFYMESVLRETILQPRLVLNPEKTNFYEMTIDDFTVENYNPIKPQLKLELGI
jgi:thymidylate synthase